MLSEIINSKFVIVELVRAQIKLRYRRTLLGYLWTLLNPLFSMTVIAVVFSTLFGMPFHVFALYLLTGMVPWLLFSNIVTQATTCLIFNEGILKKVFINKSVFPISVTLANLVDSIYSFCALSIIILYMGGKLTLALFFLPISFVLLLLFCFGISLIVSILSVKYRDLLQIIPIFLQAGFFLTPIIYRPESLHGKLKFLISLNPLVPFLELFRTPLLLGQVPSLATIGQALILVVVSLLVGNYYYQKQKNKVIFEL